MIEADFPDDPSNVIFGHNVVYDDGVYHDEYAIIHINPYMSDSLYNATAPSLQFEDNCYFNPSHDLRFSFAASTNYGSLGGYYTFEEWQALTWTDPSTGQSLPLDYDQHSVVADPQFVSIDPNLSRYDPASNAFRPALGSGCENMGAYAGLPE
jgi:hypothetical protein